MVERKHRCPERHLGFSLATVVDVQKLLLQASIHWVPVDSNQWLINFLGKATLGEQNMVPCHAVMNEGLVFASLMPELFRYHLARYRGELVLAFACVYAGDPGVSVFAPVRGFGRDHGRLHFRHFRSP